jgi:hypothetical protein
MEDFDNVDRVLFSYIFNLHTGGPRTVMEDFYNVVHS